MSCLLYDTVITAGLYLLINSKNRLQYIQDNHFQLNGEFTFRGGGGTGDKRQEFHFVGDVELLT